MTITFSVDVNVYGAVPRLRHLSLHHSIIEETSVKQSVSKRAGVNTTGHVILLGRGVSMVTCEVALVAGNVTKVTFGGVFCKVKIIMMSW